MKINLTNNPNSYLIVDMEKNEKIVSEKNSVIFSNGEFTQEKINRIEVNKQWFSRILKKVFSFDVYKAKSNIKMILAPENGTELVKLKPSETKVIIFNSSLLFAKNWELGTILEENGLRKIVRDTLWMRTEGEGDLFLKVRGQVIQQGVDTLNPIYVCESALIAFDSGLEIETISGKQKNSMGHKKKLHKIKGNGNIWIQVSQVKETSGNEDLFEGIMEFIK